MSNDLVVRIDGSASLRDLFKQVSTEFPMAVDGMLRNMSGTLRKAIKDSLSAQQPANILTKYIRVSKGKTPKNDIAKGIGVWEWNGDSFIVGIDPNSGRARTASAYQSESGVKISNKTLISMFKKYRPSTLAAVLRKAGLPIGKNSKTGFIYLDQKYSDPNTLHKVPARPFIPDVVNNASLMSKLERSASNRLAAYLNKQRRTA